MLGGGLFLSALLAPLQAADTKTGLSIQQKKEIKALIAKTLRDHPEWVINTLKAYQTKMTEKQAVAEKERLSQYSTYFADDSFAPVSGNPKGDVTIVAFIDYNCGYCKISADVVKKTIADDKNIRLVYMDTPILNPGSVTATQAALASVKQQKYDAFHTALMAFKGGLAEKSVFKVAKDTGLDIEQLKKDMQDPGIRKTIQRNISMAHSLNIKGTPAFLVNQTKILGAVSAKQLKQAVSQARAQK